MDTWGPATKTSHGNQYVLTIVGAFTHLCMFVPIPPINSEVVARAFYDNWICHHDVPEVIATDRGTEFRKHMQTLMSMHGIRHIQTMPRSPQGNGVAERVHRFLKASLLAITAGRARDWDKHLPEICRHYNATDHAGTGYSPFYLLSLIHI